MALRATPTQADVLQTLKQHAKPLSAYQLQEKLKPLHPKITVPTVYRALKFLVGQGAVHRVESVNAYIACQHSHHTSDAVLAICDDCGSVAETVAPDLSRSLTGLANAAGFALDHKVVELHGHCSDCRGQK